MQNTYNAGMSFDEIPEETMVPAGVYTVRFISASVEPNAAKKALDSGNGGTADVAKAGMNAVYTVAITGEEAELNGREFKMWIALPKEADHQKVRNDGLTEAQARNRRVGLIAMAFGGDTTNPEAWILGTPGTEASAEIEHRLNGITGEPEASLKRIIVDED